ncbi:MAG: LCP family protein [Actinomycetia bacterium]|nr:LCP family protein [Actinomycetes bacterium]
MKVPYKDKRRTKKYLTSRVQKRKKKKRVTVTAIFVVVLAIIAFVAFALIFRGYQVKEEAEKKAVEQAKELSPITFLIIGAEESGKREKASGLFVSYYDPENKEINSVLIPHDTFLEIPGQGFEMVSESLYVGIPTVILTIRNFLGINIDHYVEISKDNFEKIIGDSKLERAFLNSLASDLNDESLKKVAEKIEEISDEREKIIMLPVSTLTVGEESYLEPKKEEVEKLVTLIWGDASIEGRRAAKVIILNGCALPGVGAEVAEKLVEAGFRVIDTKNADHWNYEQTEIISYKEENKADTVKIRRTLGVGTIKYKNAPQELVDITVLIGKDYSSKKLEL